METVKLVTSSQAEKMYSKEEVLNILDKFLESMLKGEKTGLIEEWFDKTYGSKGNDETKQYPHSHIYETMNGRYGLSSYNEQDQTDGIFDTYQEAVDFGLSQLKNK